MREILFKAKRIGAEKWVVGYYVKTAEASYIVVPFPEENILGEEGKIIEVDQETLCQYTGLTDKNGKKIWENDVVKYHFGNDVAPIKFGEYQSCFDSTKAGHIGFYLDWDCEKALRKDLGYWVNMIDCNIVGNIFDNPGLL